jgi:hypothetical protein
MSAGIVISLKTTLPTNPNLATTTLIPSPSLCTVRTNTVSAAIVVVACLIVLYILPTPNPSVVGSNRVPPSIVGTAHRAIVFIQVLGQQPYRSGLLERCVLDGRRGYRRGQRGVASRGLCGVLVAVVRFLRGCVLRPCIY